MDKYGVDSSVSKWVCVFVIPKEGLSVESPQDLNKVPTVCLAEGICYNWTTELTETESLEPRR